MPTFLPALVLQLSFQHQVQHPQRSNTSRLRNAGGGGGGEADAAAAAVDDGRRRTRGSGGGRAALMPAAAVLKLDEEETGIIISLCVSTSQPSSL